MSANTTFGRFAAELTKEHERKVRSLYKHTVLVNRFGVAIERFGLTPHFVPAQDDGILLRAASTRGVDHQALLADLRLAGFHIGPAVKPAPQFNDGYEIWTAPVHGDGLEFTLLFYIAAPAP